MARCAVVTQHDFEARAYRRMSLTDEQRARLDARERAQHAAALEAFNRLFDVNAEPQQADFHTVVKVAPATTLPLRAWLDWRLGPVRYAAWIDGLYPTVRLLDKPATPDIGAKSAVMRAAKRTIPEDFGIAKTESDLKLKRVIEIAQQWKIGGAPKTISNRATKFRLENDGDDCNLNQKILFTKDEAIAFLKELQSTTKT